MSPVIMAELQRACGKRPKGSSIDFSRANTVRLARVARARRGHWGERRGTDLGKAGQKGDTSESAIRKLDPEADRCLALSTRRLVPRASLSSPSAPPEVWPLTLAVCPQPSSWRVPFGRRWQSFVMDGNAPGEGPGSALA